MRCTPGLYRGPKALELDTATDLFAPPVLWAIPHLLPCHRLSLIVAPSGTGLTHLACRLIASVAQPDNLFGPAAPQDPPQPLCLPSTSAPPAPDNPPISPPLPRPEIPIFPTALLVSFRDHPDVLRPRLLAAGANPDQVLILSEVHDQTDDVHKDPYTRPFRPDDLPMLDELLHENKGIRLICFDSAHLLFASSNRPARAKLDRQLQAFIDLAKSRECAIVFLTTIPYLAANPFRSTLLAALHEACRMVYLLAPDPEDPDRRYLLRLKHTLTEPTLSLHLHPAPQPEPSPAQSTASRGAGWQPASPEPLPAQATSPITDPASCYGVINNHYPSSLHPSAIARLSRLHATPTDLTYQQYLDRRHAPKQRGPIPHARLLAQAFLTDLLSAGQPVPVGHEHHPEPDSLRAQARAAGLSWGTVRRAMNHLPIQAQRQDNRWFWLLPTPDPLPATSSQTTSAPPPETCAPCEPSSIEQDSSSPGPQEFAVVTDPAPQHQPSPAPEPSSPSDLASCYGIITNHYPNPNPTPSAPPPETRAPYLLPSSTFPLPSSPEAA